MKITTHISFFYIEERIKYVNQIIDETNQYTHPTDVFIHTNKQDLTLEVFHEYTNGKLQIVYHDLSNIHPYYLTWKCRDLLRQQRNDYDIFMYIEDDILVPNKAIEYWLQYHELMVKEKYNLGFVRIEVKDGIEYITDLYRDQFDMIMDFHNIKCCVNRKAVYCAFWIYDKAEFGRFVDSKYFDCSQIPGYEIREKSAIGLHGGENYWYRGTLIPMKGSKLVEDCRVYHLPNNYVNDEKSHYATIPFEEAMKQSLR